MKQEIKYARSFYVKTSGSILGVPTPENFTEKKILKEHFEAMQLRKQINKDRRIFLLDNGKICDVIPSKMNYK